jgi:uncharacterized membrane protein
MEKTKKYFLKYLKTVQSNFITGVMALLPIVLTYYVVLFIYDVIKTTNAVLNEYFVGLENPGLLIYPLVFILIISIGYAISSKTSNFIYHTQDMILKKLPFVNKLYDIFKQITELFSSNGKDDKQEVVLVSFGGQKQLGFITNSIPDTNIKVVFLPTSPNPTNGYNLYVEDKELEYIPDLTKEESLKLVLSLGSLKSEKLNKYFKKKGGGINE